MASAIRKVIAHIRVLVHSSPSWGKQKIRTPSGGRDREKAPIAPGFDALPMERGHRDTIRMASDHLVNIRQGD